MGLLKQKREGQRPRDTAENFRKVANTFRSVSAGRPDGPLRPDRDRLNEAERIELISLVTRGWQDGFFAARRLGRDEKQFCALVEKACGLAPGVFRREREDEL